MANWAVVIGIDRYWSDAAHLRGAVRDALAMREWLLDPAGGNVPGDNLQLVLARTPDSPAVPEELQGLPEGTKANIIVAINNLIQLSGGKGERLYFFYAGHGLTARVSNRDESALLATDFTSVVTDHSIALRSLWEFFETTQFDDQFFFVDACRNVPPWDQDEFEIGRWTLPRTRDPGMPPVQQFIMYATSPKLKATEIRGEPGAEHGAFTAALLDGLRGTGRAKAWSWTRQCYEVRWERLADYVKKRIEEQKLPVEKTPEGALLQIPQDTGSRGVANRERDAVLASYPADKFKTERLEVLLDPDDAYPEADVRVLNALGDQVAGRVGATGGSVVFDVPPGTYALRATAPTYGEGRVTAPVELYETLPQPPTIALRRPADAPPADAAEQAAAPAPTPPVPATPPAPAAVARGLDEVGLGRIPLTAPDPLSVVEVKDETGSVVAVGRAHPKLELRLRPGFYEIRHVGPDRASRQAAIALEAGEDEKRVMLVAEEPAPITRRLLKSMGGKVGEGNAIELPGCEPAAWAQSSTLVAMALGKALQGETSAAALGLGTVPEPEPKAKKEHGRTGIALYVVSDEENLKLSALKVRVWTARDAVPEKPAQLRKLGPRLAELVVPHPVGAAWLSIERSGQGRPMVFALTVLRDRQATVVVQITTGIRLFRYQPATVGGEAAGPDTLRRVEYLQRLLLSGRLDGARELVDDLAKSDDPFVGCLRGYVLLRLGRHDELSAVVDGVLERAPQLADAFVLRGEVEAAAGSPGARQAYAEAVGTGIPVFAEGLTRLLEGLRAHDLQHPRSGLVRYVFANHMRGSMWSVFTPSRFEPGKLVITGADTGHEA